MQENWQKKLKYAQKVANIDKKCWKMKEKTWIFQFAHANLNILHKFSLILRTTVRQWYLETLPVANTGRTRIHTFYCDLDALLSAMIYKLLFFILMHEYLKPGLIYEFVRVLEQSLKHLIFLTARSCKLNQTNRLSRW